MGSREARWQREIGGGRLTRSRGPGIQHGERREGHAPTAAALLGGHVDVMAPPASSVIRYKKAAKVRVLAIGIEQRVSGVLSDVPTWKEIGIDSSFGSPTP